MYLNDCLGNVEFDIALSFFLSDNLHHSNTLKEFPFIDSKSIV